MRKNLLIIVILSFSITQVCSQWAWTVYDTGNSLLPNNFVWGVCEGQNGAIWAATDQGLVKIDGSNWTIYNSSGTGQSFNNLFDITFDKNNNLLWLKSANNLFRYDGINWIHWAAGTLYGLSVDSDAIVWQFYYDWPAPGFISSFDGNTFTEYNSMNSPLPEDILVDIAVDANDDIWILTDTSGLVRFSGDTTWTVYDSTTTNVISNYVRSIAFDSNGQPWVTGFRFPANQTFLATFDGANWVEFDTNLCAHGPLNSTAISIDQYDRKWIGDYSNGLKIIGDTTCLHYHSGNSPLPPAIINEILIASNGEVWLGTYGGGLVRIEVPVGMEELYMHYSFNVIPNPTNGSFTINFDVGNQEKVVFELMDIYGRAVYIKALNNHSTHHQVSVPETIANGVYVGRIITERKVYSEKVVVER